MDRVIIKFAQKHQRTVFKGIPKSVKKRLNFILHKINFSRYTLIEQRFLPYVEEFTYAKSEEHQVNLVYWFSRHFKIPPEDVYLLLLFAKWRYLTRLD
uniref:hypothetical protein n=2 Tax=Avibacterium paragallinarum TaxID=728 RepID=UPI000557CC79